LGIIEFEKIENSKIKKLIIKLTKLISNYELVVDIHSTGFFLNPYWIMYKPTLFLESKILNTYIPNVAILDYKYSLISVAKNGLGIEAGDTTKKDVSSVSKNLLSLIRDNFPKKNKIKYFLHYGESIQDFDYISSKINDFKIVKKGQILGIKNNKEIKSEIEFYPLWISRNKLNKKGVKCYHLLKRIKEKCLF
jgi:hypothetical protein